MDSDEFILFSLKSYLALKKNANGAAERDEERAEQQRDANGAAERDEEKAEPQRHANGAAERNEERAEQARNANGAAERDEEKAEQQGNANGAAKEKESDGTKTSNGSSGKGEGAADASKRNVEVVRGTGEKPYLSPRVAEFSLTHTEGFLAVAFSEIPVGVDVENRLRFQKRTISAAASEWGEIPLYRKIAERFFGVSVADEDSFFELWTKREAIAKRDETVFPKREYVDGGTTEFFREGDYLIAVAY